MKYVFIRNHNDELMHYGTHGMKWGHRKAQYTSSTASKSATGINKIKSMLGSNKTQKTYKTAKKENKQKIKETYKNLNKQASTKDKIIYNNATRKKAAKYIVNNNMTVKEATAKSKKDAWRNTAVIMGAYGGLSVAALYKMNH